MTTNTIQRASGVQTVSPAELARRRSNGLSTDMIDVRTPAEFAEVHAEHAKLIPLDVLDPKAAMADRTGSADDPIYVLCKSGARAAKAVDRFRAAGFDNVFSVEGGTQAWERAGLPVVRGEKIMSIERQTRIGAGALVLVGLLLGWLVHPVFFGVSAIVGAGLLFAGVTDWCGMGLLLAKLPWNRRGCEGSRCSR